MSGLKLSLLAACAIAACRPGAPALFETVPPDESGVAFVNRLPEDTTVNILTYLYYYNGGGVAAGDVNGDGLPDLYFTSNRGSNRLYLNKGNFRFADVTATAGVADSAGWKTGVTMADVNGDGRLDIYVSAVAKLAGRNALFINNGDGTFTDRARDLGLDYAGYSTQALFFDYDGDGDLDVYLLNHTVHRERAAGADRLLRNDGGHFTDVTRAAGIRDSLDGYGLGVVASDVNGDGCPDLYVANDFQGDDALYLNNCNGTFRDVITTATGHTSRFSMGVDAADFDNDGRPDLAVLDMLPDDETALKTTASTESFSLFSWRRELGYHPQYERNTLQLNRGQGRFSDIGFLAGVAATDWSWSPLFADFDNDGLKDLVVTSGVYRRPNDLDFIAYIGTPAAQQAIAKGDLSVLRRMPQAPLPKAAFHNNGDSTFTNLARDWGLSQPAYSNGAVYVDLDNDGALDLVVNTINAPASIYRNLARSRNGNHSLEVVLRGDGANTAGIGAKVAIVVGGRRQLLEQMPTRGFESSVDPRLHFGLGAATIVDSLTVIWPDRRVQVMTGIRADQTITLQATGAARPTRPAPRPTPRVPLFTDLTDRLRIAYRHRENPFFDYDREPLMPHALSTEGPALAVADVNGDGLDDIYVGGAKWQPGSLFIQRRDGTFQATDQPAVRADSLAEDVDAAFFDADGDGKLDLYVVSGGNEFWGNAEPLRDRLYINDGRAHFRRAEHALPPFFHNGSVVAPAGNLVFVGSRVVARAYGTKPRSYLLQNDGAGRFTDVTRQRAPALADIGMVTAATWVDYDRDGHLDLIVVGEWMPVRVFRQEADGRFTDQTVAAGLAGTNGWWNSVTAADLNGDGRPDLILGNLGLNSFVHASPAEPARLFVGDFSGNGPVQQILTSYRHGTAYPLAGRDELLQAIPRLRERYPTYHAFDASRIEDIFSRSELRRAIVLEARELATAVAISKGDGTFALRPLPAAAQLAPMYAGLSGDFDGDGHADLLMAGNFYGVPPMQGRYDASYGVLLRGDGKGGFAGVALDAGAPLIEGQVRRMAWLKRANGTRVIVVAKNDGGLQVIAPLHQ